MKKKRTSFLLLLFSVLLLVGFSPPNTENKNITNNNSLIVYADETIPQVFTEDISAYKQSIIDYMDTYGLFKDSETERNTLITNLGGALSDLNSLLNYGIYCIESLMMSLSILVIAITGFSYLNSGRGNLINFIKSKQKLSNAFLAIVFVTNVYKCFCRAFS